MFYVIPIFVGLLVFQHSERSQVKLQILPNAKHDARSAEHIWKNVDVIIKLGRHWYRKELNYKTGMGLYLKPHRLWIDTNHEDGNQQWKENNIVWKKSSRRKIRRYIVFSDKNPLKNISTKSWKICLPFWSALFSRVNHGKVTSRWYSSQKS